MVQGRSATTAASLATSVTAAQNNLKINKQSRQQLATHHSAISTSAVAIQPKNAARRNSQKAISSNQTKRSSIKPSWWTCFLQRRISPQRQATRHSMWTVVHKFTSVTIGRRSRTSTRDRQSRSMASRRMDAPMSAISSARSSCKCWSAARPRNWCSRTWRTCRTRGAICCRWRVLAQTSHTKAKCPVASRRRQHGASSHATTLRYSKLTTLCRRGVSKRSLTVCQQTNGRLSVRSQSPKSMWRHGMSGWGTQARPCWRRRSRRPASSRQASCRRCAQRVWRARQPSSRSRIRRATAHQFHLAACTVTYVARSHPRWVARATWPSSWTITHAGKMSDSSTPRVTCSKSSSNTSNSGKHRRVSVFSSGARIMEVSSRRTSARNFAWRTGSGVSSPRRTRHSRTVCRNATSAPWRSTVSACCSTLA